MERVLMLMLEAVGCAAEAQINGMPVAALAAGGGRVCVAVHEYLLSGRNQLGLAIGASVAPGPEVPQPRIATSAVWARARLLLVRQGHSPVDERARELAVLDWSAAEGSAYETPALRHSEVELPVAFQRWRWLDAPPIGLNPAVQRQVLEFVQQLALEFGRGNPEPWLVAARLRFEELALAYQRPVAEAVQRFREHLQALHVAKALKIVPPTADDLVLRPLVDGRLIDCVTPLGAPVLRTQNDAPLANHAWPIRLAMVEGKIYVLR
ncbi:MAG: hypothetical protein ABIO45_11635 [Burkholderiaceae bacterium]